MNHICLRCPSGKDGRCHIGLESKYSHFEATIDLPVIECNDPLYEGYVLTKDHALNNVYISVFHFQTEDNVVIAPKLLPWGRYFLKAFVSCESQVRQYVHQEFYTGPGRE